MVMSFCSVLSSLRQSLLPRRKVLMEGHCLGHNWQNVGSKLQGAPCGKQLQAVLWQSQTALKLIRAGWAPSSAQNFCLSGEHPTAQLWHVYEKAAVMRGMKHMGRRPWGLETCRERLLRTWLEMYPWKEAQRDISQRRDSVMEGYLPGTTHSREGAFLRYCTCGQGHPGEPLLLSVSSQIKDALRDHSHCCPMLGQRKTINKWRGDRNH